MLKDLERLVSGHSGFRILSVLVCLFTTALACWWLLLQPRQQHLREGGQQNQQVRQHVISLQQKMAALPELQPLPDATPAKSFSALEAVRLSGGRLVKWQPGARAALLDILLPWPKVPPFFQQLANYPRVRLPGFALRGAGEQVRVLLTLEFADEDR
ncbi:hypothetical protein [Cedecea sp.]|uniref:HofO family protein n=1 Tax=Cedecea sp. TaxID=1970739 RepID=UPI0012AD7C64|nr:hypothetical protein [Enterobacteriaceae bacterium RIT693]